ncbi:MAG: DegV family protein [Candidatus Promineifilaceae bacterium]
MRVVMDDAGDVPDEMISNYGIRIVPVNISFGTEQYLSGIDLDHDAFYERIGQVKDSSFPKTSQPTPFQFRQIFKEILDNGESEILTVVVSQRMSGTYDSALAATRELEGRGDLHLFDSMAGSAAQGLLAIEAARLAREGRSTDTILQRLYEMREQTVVVFMVQSLEYAVRSGRISSLRSVMASLLKIKPILTVKHGTIVEAGRVRTYGKAMEAIVDFVHQRFRDQPLRVGFIHARAPAGVLELQQLASEKLQICESFLKEMSISVAINLGPGALGIAACPC